MKKILLILGIVVVVILILLITAPLLFKSQIVTVVKDQANQNLNATLNFRDIGLSFFKNFPRMTASIEDLTIVNDEPFAGDTLVYLKEFQATINLSSLIFGKQVEIVSLQLVEPRILSMMLPDGRANWDIVPVDTSAAPAETTATAFNLAVQKYEITDANIYYVDQASGMAASVEGLSHHGQGDFDQALFTLMTRTIIKSLTVKMADVAYLNKAELEIKADIEMDMEQLKFAFKDNEIRLNQLFLNLDGWLAMPNENDIDMDISFKTSKADFKNILSMVPVIYMKDFGELQADGQLALAGTIKGTYNKHSVPSFDINLGVQNGMFQYPTLPTPVKNVAVDLNINCPGRDLDKTIVDLRRFHLEILNEPINFVLKVKTPVSDPFIDAKFTGKVNLAEVKNVVPMEEEYNLSGMVNADFRFQGLMSDIENQRPEKLKATGDISVNDVVYAAATMPVEVQVKSARLKLTAFNASLSNLDVRLGDSDIKANGGLDNMIGFVLSDQTLKGSLNIQSTYFDLTPWMTQEDTSALVAVEVPDKIEFVMNADFGKIKMDNLVMTNTTGQIIVKNRQVKMVGLRSNLVKGSMVSNGTYEYIPPKKPHIDFDLEITNFSIPEMFSTFVTVQKVAPLAEYLKGNVSGKLVLKSDLGDSLMPDVNTLYSKGSLNIPKAEIKGLKALNQIADKVKIKELKDPALVNFNPSYTIENGRLSFNPTNYKLGAYDAETGGSVGFDQTLNLAASVKVPTTELGEMVGQDLSMLKGQVTEVPANIGGTVKSPSVSIPVDQIAGNILDQLKQAGKKVVEDKAKEELDKKKKDLEQQAKDKLKGLFGK
jgi:hypothetical protein